MSIDTMTFTQLVKEITDEKDNTVIPNRYLAFVKGDYVAAVVLKVTVYWSSRNPDRDGWFYFTEAAWQREYHVSRKQVDRALTKLNQLIGPDEMGLPFIEKDVRKVRLSGGTLSNETAMHFRVNPDLFVDLIITSDDVGDGTHRDGQSGLPWSGKDSQSGTDRNNQSSTGRNDQSLNKKNGENIREDNRHTNTPSPAHAGARVGDQIACAPDATRDDRFQRWWDVYPKRRAREAAEQVWRRLKPDDALTDRMIAAVNRQKRGEQWRKEGGRFIPHPAKWLSEGRWEDDTEIDTEGTPTAQLRSWQDSRWAYALERFRWSEDITSVREFDEMMTRLSARHGTHNAREWPEESRREFEATVKRCSNGWSIRLHG